MKHKSEDYKMAAVRYLQEVSHSRKATCRALKCSTRSLGRWVNRLSDTGRICRHNRPPVAYKVTEEQARFAVLYLQQHQTVSMHELLVVMNTQFPGLQLTSQHLGSVVRDSNLTRKRTRHGHFPAERYRQPVDRRAELSRFYAITGAQPLDKIISIDETSLTPFMYRAYSRCDLGDRCIQRTSNNRVFTKHTFIAAITSTGLLSRELYDEGASNTQRFLAFLTEMIRRHRLRGYLFLMDNAGAHKNVAVRDLIASSGNTILYTVPYNPQTNAIENWFSQFKHYMATSKVRTVPGIRDDILVAITHIMPEHYRHYFEYAYRRGRYPDRPRARSSTRRRQLKAYRPAQPYLLEV